MPSKWKIGANIIDGTKVFAVCRVINADRPDHSGNQEYATSYLPSRDEARVIADRLNSGEDPFDQC